MGPISTCVFKLEMNGAPVSSGMGTCGLVGQIGMYTGWVADGIANSPFVWIGMILTHIVLPAVICWGLGLLMRKIGWIKENDLKLDL